LLTAPTLTHTRFLTLEVDIDVHLMKRKPLVRFLAISWAAGVIVYSYTLRSWMYTFSILPSIYLGLRFNQIMDMKQGYLCFSEMIVGESNLSAAIQCEN
jgi:hypothetical protein